MHIRVVERSRARGLLTIYKGSIKYKTTEKGLDFLEKYNSFREYRPLKTSTCKGAVKEEVDE